MENPNRFALSYSLKLNKNTVYQNEAEFYFANLLPEGNARDTLCRKLGISLSNDFELLKKIGRDCAGALVITEENHFTQEHPELKEIAREDLEKWLKQGSTGILDLQVSGELRLSLAGAQDKLPLVYKDQKFYQPLGGHPTTHILKPPPERFKYLPENEWFQARLSKKLGLPTAPSELIKIGSTYSLLVERYDRIFSAETWTRLHQEDFCQALGVSAKKKYQSEGGPSFGDCAQIINERSSQAITDIDHLVKWLIFNIMIGNCDAHAKNISLLRNSEGQWHLAPFYDLVSTRSYEDISHKLAMSVSNQYDSGSVHLKHWRVLFADCQVSQAHYIQTIKNLVAVMPKHISETKQEFNLLYGNSPILAILEKTYHTQLRRISNGLNET